MSSTRRLTDIPSCMRMSFDFPWESSPEKEISNPLSYELPDFIADFGIIYGEEAARGFFSCPPSTPAPTKGGDLPSVHQDDSADAGGFLELFGSEITPELPSETWRSLTPSSGYPNDLHSLFYESPSPNPQFGVMGREMEWRAVMGDAATPGVLRKPRPFGSPPSTSSSDPSSSDDMAIPEFMRGLQRGIPETPTVGPSFLHESHGPGFHPQRPSNSRLKLRHPLPSTHNLNASAPQRPEAFAHRYCRYPNCSKRFKDKRTTERHRFTHLSFGIYVCPNNACASRSKTRPNFTRGSSLVRHFKLSAAGSPCAEGKDKEVSSFRRKVAEAEALIQQALVPFNPAIHAPF